jgi:hypothetical protein
LTVTPVPVTTKSILRRLDPKPAGHLRGIGINLMAAIEEPQYQSDFGCGLANGHRC